MAKQVLTIRLEAEDVAGLDAAASHRGVSRSDWLRRMIQSQNDSDRKRGIG